MGDLDFQGLAASLLSRARPLLESWLPGGKVQGHEYVCAGLNGGSGRSFSVNLTNGKWSEFNGVDDLKGGDLTSLYAAINHIGQGEAFRLLSAEVGLAVPSASSAPRIPSVVITKPPVDAPAPELRGASMHWCYRDLDGSVIFYVLRFDEEGDKTIRPMSWDSTSGKWTWKGFNEPRPLYGLELLAARPDDPIILVEGEKSADAARVMLGDLYVVMTWPNGAAGFSPKKVDWTPIYGRKVLCWGDADLKRFSDKQAKLAGEHGLKPGDLMPHDIQPGRRCMLEIAAILHPHCPEVKILDPGRVETRKDGWDAADALADGWDWDTIKLFAEGKVKVYEPPPMPEPLAEEELIPEPPDLDIKVAAAAKSGKRSIAAAAHITMSMDGGEADGHKQAFGRIWSELGIQVTKQGVVANVDNVLRAMEKRQDFMDLIWFDDFHQKLFTNMNFQTWEKEDEPRLWRDVDTLFLMSFMQRHLGMTKITETVVGQALQVHGHNNLRNEPKTWLRGLKWDGQSRIEHFFCAAFGVASSDYAYAASKNFWIAMVARILQPGCQVDNMIILEGDQGSFKSSALRMIGGKWGFECRDNNILGKDFSIGLQGKSLVIINEWDKFKKGDMAALKDTISTPVDSYRPLFGKHSVDHKRTCVFIATTNKRNYLLDNTGARRYWPLKTTKIFKSIIENNREQCFAEAVSRFEAGESWWEMPIEETLQQQEERRVPDEWESLIEEWTFGRDNFTITDIAVELFKLPLADIEHKVSHRIGECLNFLGWRSRSGRINNVSSKIFSKEVK